jgi:hypothetical protein
MKQSNAQDRNLYQILIYQKHPNVTVSLHAPDNYNDRKIKQEPIRVMKAYGGAQTYLYSILTSSTVHPGKKPPLLTEE